MLDLAPGERVQLRVYTKQLSWIERTMLDALRSRAGSGWSRLALTGAPAGLPEPFAASAAAVARAGLGDVIPLLDGRPLALMAWRDVPRHGSVSQP